MKSVLRYFRMQYSLSEAHEQLEVTSKHPSLSAPLSYPQHHHSMKPSHGCTTPTNHVRIQATSQRTVRTFDPLVERHKGSTRWYFSNLGSLADDSPETNDLQRTLRAMRLGLNVGDTSPPLKFEVVLSRLMNHTRQQDFSRKMVFCPSPGERMTSNSSY